MDSVETLNKAQQAAELGDYEQSRKLLMGLLRVDPNNRNGWLLLSEVVTKPEHAIKSLERVLALDPGNEAARLRLTELQGMPVEVFTQAPTASLWAYQEAAPLSGTRLDCDDSAAGAASPGSPFGYVEADPETEALAGLAAGTNRPTPASASTWTYVEANQAADQEDAAWDGAPSGLGNWQAAGMQVVPTPTDPPPHADWLKPKAPAGEKPAKKKGGRWEWLLIGVLGLAAVCILGLMLVPKAAGKVTAGLPAVATAPANEDLLAPIYTNIRASNAENYELYMATIHSQSPAYSQTSEMLSGIFSQYDLSYEVTGLEVLQASSREARVAFVLTTRKLRGPDFRDNRVSGEMILRPEGGTWKIYNQKVDTVDYLD